MLRRRRKYIDDAPFWRPVSSLYRSDESLFWEIQACLCKVCNGRCCSYLQLPDSMSEEDKVETRKVWRQYVEYSSSPYRCLYYKNNECAIQEDKPMVCKSYSCIPYGGPLSEGTNKLLAEISVIVRNMERHDGKTD